MKASLTKPAQNPQTGDLVRGGESASVGLLDLVPRTRAPADVGHDLGIGIQLDLELEVAIGEGLEPEALGVENRLRHLFIVNAWERRSH